MKKSIWLTTLLFAMAAVFTACGGPSLKIEYEKYTLDNGLEVILHEDHSDPIVSTAIVMHVGSNREEPGRTGFAHLFEHILFQESENVGQDQFFKNIQNAGGTLNGFTFEDGTVYFEIVPENALEMVLWMESDRMGYLLNKVTQEAFENQQDVVLNEKRFRYDNRPYGHTEYVIRKALYPEDHPYNWDVIGSSEDIKQASLADVKKFYLKWYGPNNATLVIAGDFDKAATKALVQKYFGDIRPAGQVLDPAPRHVTLTETKRLYHEDNFAKSPELNMVYPSVEQYLADAYALEILADLLADGKKAPLYKVIVKEKKLAPTVTCFQYNMEITGSFRFAIRAFPEARLGAVEEAIHEALTRFETEGFTDSDLNRIKAKTETAFYNGIASIFNKALNLGIYNEYKGTPGFLAQDLQNYLDVTRADVLRVYETYIKDKPYVLTNFVPKGRMELLAENMVRSTVVEESIVAAGERETGEQPAEEIEVAANPSSFDRSTMPALGTDPEIKIPTIWHDRLTNGIPVLGIVHDELPLVQFSITLRGGQLLDSVEKAGAANLVSDMLMEGTRGRTPEELEEAIDNLGSRIVIYTGNETMSLEGRCLSSKFNETLALAGEILFEPRWDEVEFDRLKAQTLEAIHRSKANPGAISANTFAMLLYGEDHILGQPIIGTSEAVENITLEDLKEYYQRSFSASVAHVNIVGDISRRDAVSAFAVLAGEWPATAVAFPEQPETPVIDRSRLYFVDIPGAKQSQIRIGHLGMAYTDPDYYPAFVMNYKLGGSFSGVLNMILREEKGFTYGARSRFAGQTYPGPFSATAAVQSNTTYESMTIFRDELERYRQGIPQADIDFTRSALVRSNARAFETLAAIRGMLNRIARFDLPDNYVQLREDYVRGLTVEEHQRLAQQHINPGRMVYLVVGDAATQLEPLRKFGLGDPVLLEAR